MSRRRSLSTVAALCALLAGCATGGGDAAKGENPYAGWVRRLDRAVECGAAEPGFLGRAVEHPDPAVRREAARAIGALAPPDAVVLLLPRLAATEEREVRVAALFALGLLGRPEAFPPLAGILAEDPDPALRRHAAIAIGRLAGDGIAPEAVRALTAALADADPAVRGGAALAVWRQGAAAVPAVPSLAALLDGGPDEVRWRAAYALMQIDDPATLPPLRARLADPHPWVRAFAAWGMRRPADPEAIESLHALLADPTSGTAARIQALRSLGALRAAPAGDAGSPDPEAAPRRERIRDILIEHLMREEHPGALEALLEALAAGAGEIEVPFIAAALERAEQPTVRRAAIRALGRAAKEGALDLLGGLSGESDPFTRAAVADALGAVGEAGGPLLTALLRDSDARVRAAAAAAVSGIDAPFRWPLLETVVADPDLAVRATAVEAFAKERPDRWIEILATAWRESQEPEHWELRAGVLAALAEPAGATAAVLAAQGLEDPFLAVRIAAAKILARPPPTEAEAPRPRGLPFPRIDDPFAADADPRATIETEKGSLVIALFLDAAPRHVAGFIALAESGAYDGLLFHRVVPSFVVQGADPRGDGWGDAGYHLVDEFHPTEFVRGTVGMPRAGNHTGGSQLFITHLPTPHLDGRYTVFGQLVEGLEVVDRLEVGDRIVRVTVSRGERGRRAAF